MLKLTIILPTETPLTTVERIGFLISWESRLAEYSKYYKNIELYSFDTKNYSTILNVNHHPMPFKIPVSIPYINHFIYNIYLLIKARKMTETIRVYFTTFFILDLIRKLFKKKIVLSYHYFYAATCRTDYSMIKGILAKYLERLCINSADIVFSSTAEIQKYLFQKYAKKTIVIPETITTLIFYPSLRKEKLILYAGRLVRSKGIDVLLRAFKLINKSFPDYVLKIAGGMQKDIIQFKTFLMNQNIKNVQFLGELHQLKLADLIRKATAVVLPTITSEGQAKILLETMACGSVCISTDVPGNRFTIKHKFNGILVPRLDHVALAKAIEEVIINHKLRKKIATNALKTAQSFDLHAVIKKEIDIINNLKSHV